MSITVVISIFSMFLTVIIHPELIVVHSILNGFGLLVWRTTEEKE
jgi:nitrate reductase NapE component